MAGGFAPGQRDLCRDTGTELIGRHPGFRLLTALKQIEGDGQTGLTGSQGRLLVFQAPDFSYQTRTVRLRYVGANGDAFIFRCKTLPATKGAVAPQCCRGWLSTVHSSSVPEGYDIIDGQQKPVSRFGGHWGSPHTGRRSRHTAEDQRHFESGPDSGHRRAQLLQPPQGFKHPCLALGQSKPLKRAVAHRYHAAEFVLAFAFRSVVPVHKLTLPATSDKKGTAATSPRN